MGTPELPPELMLAGEVAKRIPYSQIHLRRMEAQGRFPRRVRLGANRVGWVRAEVDQWLSDRIGERQK
jgi:prophage regulatory protein